jgi:hypothetical protein
MHQCPSEVIVIENTDAYHKQVKPVLKKLCKAWMKDTNNMIPDFQLFANGEMKASPAGQKSFEPVAGVNWFDSE